MSVFNKVRNWFLINKIDTLNIDQISYGSLLQVEIYQYINTNAFIYKRIFFENKIFKFLNLKHFSKLLWSYFLSFNQKLKKSDILLVFDTDNNFTINSLNMLGNYLESNNVSVTGVICSPNILRKCTLKSKITPKLYFNSKNLKSFFKKTSILFKNFEKNFYFYYEKGINKKILYYIKLQLPILVFESLNLFNLLSSISPKTIVLGNDCHRTSRLFAQLSTKLSVKSYVIQHGLTTWKYGYLPLYADYIFVWGNYFSNWFIKNGVSSNRIIVSGNPLYSNHENILKERKSNKRKIFLFTNPLNRKYLENLTNEFISLKFPANCEPIIKIHPSENINFYNSIIKKFGVNINIQNDSLENLDICRGDIAIIINSSAGYDACLKGALILSVQFKDIPVAIDFKSYNLGDICSVHGIEKQIHKLLNYDFSLYNEYFTKFKADYVNNNTRTLPIIFKHILS